MNKIKILAFLLCFPAAAIAQVFNIEDIRIEGLQRVSSGSVFSALPVRVNELADEVLVQESIRSLFRTGFFEDIRVERDGNVLVFHVSERPAISVINLEGNKAIGDEDLFASLSENGLSEGQIFEPAVLDGMSKALSREYVGQGLYGSSIETNVRTLPRNRVAIDITIDEGDKAKIRSVQVLGSKDFSERELLGLFESTTGGLLTFLSGNDRYSREKLSGDLERLESFYLDQGYVQFRIDSTQVSVSPDKTSVFITVNIDEGDVYTVNEVGLLGDTVINENILKAFLVSMEGRTFSQSTITFTKETLSARLGNEGYTFAEINEIVDINDDDKTVDLTFFIDPRQRVYVRRVEFRGNTRTEDEVLRREMRQMESAIASNQLVESGKIRLDRLGFFSQVTSETVPVPGTSDQIDVIYDVEEQTSGSISASIGFAQTSGAIIGLSLQENNFLGSGNSVSVALNRSSFQESASFALTNPYFTPDGVSAGFSLFARATDFGDFRLASFTTDSFGLNLSFGYPLSEISRLNTTLGYEFLDVDPGTSPSQEILDFTGDDSESFNQWKIQTSWIRSTLNRGVFATRGDRQRLSVEVAVPGSDAPFYRLSFEGQKFIPVYGPFTLKLSTELGFGDSFESDRRLPFFENYFAGGFGSVRGFEQNTLGPRESFPTSIGIDEDGFSIPPPAGTFDPDPDPIGGNVLFIGRAEMLLPVPFIEQNRSLQASAFIDVGNVFDTNCSLEQELCFSPSFDELRYSTGIAMTWLSGFGPLSFAIARTFNFEEGEEEEEFFQFSLGQTF